MWRNGFFYLSIRVQWWPFLNTVMNLRVP
jgi:hypothetical protein